MKMEKKSFYIWGNQGAEEHMASQGHSGIHGRAGTIPDRLAHRLMFLPRPRGHVLLRRWQLGVECQEGPTRRSRLRSQPPHPTAPL